MTDLLISIPIESNESDETSETNPRRAYTPIDDLGDDAMCDNYILYDESSVPEKVTMDQAIEKMIHHKNHMYLTSKNLWCIHIGSFIKYLLNHNKELYDDLDKFVDSMDPNPCKEFIKKHEKEEKLKYILEQKAEIINFNQIFHDNKQPTW
jgi:hypothetical protein